MCKAWLGMKGRKTGGEERKDASGVGLTQEPRANIDRRKKACSASRCSQQISHISFVLCYLFWILYLLMNSNSEVGMRNNHCVFLFFICQNLRPFPKTSLN